MITHLKTPRGDYDIADNCDYIEEHSARGEGDRWFYNVSVGDGTIIRVFDPIEVWIHDAETERKG